MQLGEMGNRLECTDQVSVEFGSHIEEDLVGSISGQRRLIRAPLNECPEHIRNRHDADEVGNFLSLQPMRIARTVEVFVVVHDNVEHLGGKDKASDNVRLFMAPGMGHCQGGPGLNTFDTLAALENWVERRIAPDTLTASHTNLTFPVNVETSAPGDFSRPLCAYPKVATWTGSGSATDSSGYVCQ